MFQRDSRLAFDDAIACKYLYTYGGLPARWIIQPREPNRYPLADDYMYMYSTGSFDYFKHRETREYLACPATK